MTIRALCAGGLMMLASCASQTEMGVRAYAVGHYDKAYERWVPAAAAGDAPANYNLGLLWQQGLTTQTPRNEERAGEFFQRAADLGMPLAMGPAADYQLSKNNPDAALALLNSGARWNDAGSIQRLQKLGAPIPSPDLAAAQQQALLAQQQIQGQNAYALGQILGCAIGGGCGQPAPTYQAPPQAQTPPTTGVNIRCRADMMKDLNGNPVYRCH